MAALRCSALARRVMEIKNEDSEIALRHVFAVRYPDRVGDSQYNRERAARISTLVRATCRPTCA